MDIGFSFIRQLNSKLRKLERENAELKIKVDLLISALNDETRLRKYYFNSLDTSKYEQPLKDWYMMRTGKLLDLENPRTFNEKLQWLKLYDSTQKKADLSDKYKVRKYVAEKLGEEYLVPLLGAWNVPDEIPFDELPDKFVLKATHGCKYNIIVTDKSSLDINAAKEQLRQWLAEDYAFHNGFEMHYSLIDRKIIAEEYIENTADNLCDYKIFCFNGKAKYILYITQRRTNQKMSFYDLQWNRLPIVNMGVETADIPRPDNLDKLIEIAEILAEGFLHVRVDLYILNNGAVKFGEMTFSPASGARKWDPPEYDKIFGDHIILPTDVSNSQHDYRRLIHENKNAVKVQRGNDYITFQWKAEQGANMYKLQQQIGMEWKQIALPLKPEYTIKGLEPNTDYYFRVFPITNGQLGHPMLISAKTL